ncbi:Hypothetical Protein FCC1311_021352 [Hondaea fermentalgiana]|uniref:Uncharacterized protein n=1 Tax=Hondaea fermentalgiana TaxID=2315210 RepID=A0A2R5G4G5_9STRA|nr:Hypothetical Protein FCC1311_021352 [Hondaea fermentalgiana]|eukprot:GBG25916.1 Hypothetical Protein FCC1311_021352 [Hondaea fermentalgiana]
MPAEKKQKPSRHGTLCENDTVDAVAVDTIQVLQHYTTEGTKDYFGEAGKLPPEAAQMHSPRYVVYHTFRDEKDDTDWIGLKLSSNSTKGSPPAVPLVPGEYKIELKLPKDLNRNVAYDTAGAIIGGISTLGAQDEEKANEAFARGLPTSYVDVQVIAGAKKYAVLSTRGILDLGLHSSFVRSFCVQPHDGDVTLQVKMHSHTVLKRLKVEAKLYRRDFHAKEMDAAEARRRATAKRGKAILHQALAAAADTPRQRLDPDVDIRHVVESFYGDMAPERLPNLDFVFRHFAGRDDDLINTIEAKYGVRFDRRGNYINR